jgi:hypothetical protein
MINVRNIESLMQFSDRCGPWKVSNGAENLILQAVQFQQMGICRKLLECHTEEHTTRNLTRSLPTAINMVQTVLRAERTHQLCDVALSSDTVSRQIADI